MNEKIGQVKEKINETEYDTEGGKGAGGGSVGGWVSFAEGGGHGWRRSDYRRGVKEEQGTDE